MGLPSSNLTEIVIKEKKPPFLKRLERFERAEKEESHGPAGTRASIYANLAGTRAYKEYARMPVSQIYGTLQF